MTRRQRLLLVLVLLLAALFRLTGLDWDAYEHYHPDERYVSWVATTIEWPDSWATAFDPQRSSFNPFYWPPGASSAGIEVLQDQPRDFAYGHLPLYMGVAATRLVERLRPLADLLPESWLLASDLLNGAGLVEFDHLTAVARALTALVDVATVFLTFTLGRRLYDVWPGLLAAAFLALTVQHIQLAHFFLSDPYLTFLTTAAILLMVVAAQRPGNWRPIVLASVAIGLAVGAKFAAVMLFLPLLLLMRDAALSERQAAGRMLLAVAIAALAFALTNPFALLDWSCPFTIPSTTIGPVTIPPISLGSCYLKNVLQQSDMVSGGISYPFTRQYIGTRAYIYPVLMQLRWGMGWLLGLVAFAGFGWLLLRALVGVLAGRRPGLDRRLQPLLAGNWPPLSAGEGVVVAFALPFFLVTGGFFVKFMRYMQPLLPLLVVAGAGLLWQIARQRRRIAVLLAGLTLAATALYAVAFVSLYAEPHPWVMVSRWLHENARTASVIATEKWDEALPSSVTVGGELRSRNVFEAVELDWLGGIGPNDTTEKLAQNLERLAASDYLIVASNRSYGVAGRLPAYYPLTGRYYAHLFAADLGFEPVFVAGRAPRLGPLWLWPDPFEHARLQPPPLAAEYLASRALLRLGYADESFTVYDQPFAIIFRNTGRLSPAEMMARIAAP